MDLRKSCLGKKLSPVWGDEILTAPHEKREEIVIEAARYISGNNLLTTVPPILHEVLIDEVNHRNLNHFLVYVKSLRRLFRDFESCRLPR